MSGTAIVFPIDETLKKAVIIAWKHDKLLGPRSGGSLTTKNQEANREETRNQLC